MAAAVDLELTFAGAGKLGLVFPSGQLPLRLARVAADGLAAREHPTALKPGMVLVTVQGKPLAGLAYAAVMQALGGNAGRPLTLGFRSPQSSVALSRASVSFPAAAAGLQVLRVVGPGGLGLFNSIALTHPGLQDEVANAGAEEEPGQDGELIHTVFYQQGRLGIDFGVVSDRSPSAKSGLFSHSMALFTSECSIRAGRWCRRWRPGRLRRNRHDTLPVPAFPLPLPCVSTAFALRFDCLCPANLLPLPCISTACVRLRQCATLSVAGARAGAGADLDRRALHRGRRHTPGDVELSPSAFTA